MIDFEHLRTVLSYDPASGQMFWCLRMSPAAAADQRAGSDVSKRGYRSVRIYGKDYLEHRLIWFWMTSEWPVCDIDHINRKKTDNRWKNLRLANDSLNQANSSIKCNNTSGVKGVTLHRRNKIWQASIEVQKAARYLGSFKNKTDAAICYNYNAAHHFGEFVWLNPIANYIHD